MEWPWILTIIAAVVLLVVLAAMLAARRRRSEALRQKFGPEYDQAVAEAGNTARAEAELAARQKRVQAFDIHPLADEERQRFGQAWLGAQTRFVDEPRQAIIDAEQLVVAALQARGYPMSDFDQLAADLSVEHSQVVAHYRAAREIAKANEAGHASTEQLRQGLIHYRALFDDLLGAETAPEPKELTQ